MGLLELFYKDISHEAFYSMGSDSGVIIYFPAKQEECKSGTDLLGIQLSVEYIMDNYDVNSAKIICFGNNLYGKEIIKIWNNYPDVQIDLMVCSPEASILKARDRHILKQKIHIAENHEKTIVYASELPPTLRACILYDANAKPVLCCVQNYVLAVNEQRKPSFAGRETPCIIAYCNEDVFPLYQYVEFCEKEFLRLQCNVYK